MTYKRDFMDGWGSEVVVSGCDCASEPVLTATKSGIRNSFSLDKKIIQAGD